MPSPINEFFISTKLPILHVELIFEPGRILAKGPIVHLSPIVAPNIIVFGLIKTFLPILQAFFII